MSRPERPELTVPPSEADIEAIGAKRPSDDGVTRENAAAST